MVGCWPAVDTSLISRKYGQWFDRENLFGRKYNDNDKESYNLLNTEFIARQTADLLNPRNREMSAAKDDNDNEMGDLRNRWIY